LATRRRYKTGGAVAADIPVESADVVLPPEVPADPVIGDDGDDAIMRAAQGVLRAEEIQRQQQAPPTLDQIIANIPNLTDHKRAFLRAHPQFVTHGPSTQAMSQAYRAAMRAGIADDTEQMNQAILEGVDRIQDRQLDHEVQVARLTAARPRAEEPATISRLTQEPEVPPAPQSNGGMVHEPAPAPIRKSMPITAPVSRDVPSASGPRVSEARTITLTAEQRLIARNSFGPIKDRNGRVVDMSDDEKERLYASNLRRYQQMLANGTYVREG
jgi:hypothetical protein